MARIAPTTITLDPAQTVTLDLKPNPELSSQTTALVALADHVVVRTAADSVEASAFLARVQHLRRWVAGIYKDAKAPLTTAKRTLDAQERALLVPLAEAEQRVMREIVSFQAQHQQDHERLESGVVEAQLAGASVALPAPLAVTSIDGMQSRTTYSADVVDFRALVLAVAGQLLLDTPGSTRVTQAWLRAVCRPTPQATITLLEPSAPALHARARALKDDLSVPGVTSSTKTTLVAR